MDLVMPVMDGNELSEILKNDELTSHIPIILLTAKSELESKIEGLETGADDYLTKPFHLAELNSRVKAILRRQKFGGGNVVMFNEIKIDTDSHVVTVGKEEVVLTKKEYDLLLFFIINKNKVLSKEIIAEHLWGDNSDLIDNFDFIYVHVNNLRKKLTQEGAKYIKTAYGSGYKFIDE